MVQSFNIHIKIFNFPERTWRVQTSARGHFWKIRHFFFVSRIRSGQFITFWSYFESRQVNVPRNLTALMEGFTNLKRGANDLTKSNVWIIECQILQAYLTHTGVTMTHTVLWLSIYYWTLTRTQCSKCCPIANYNCTIHRNGQYSWLFNAWKYFKMICQ